MHLFKCRAFGNLPSSEIAIKYSLIFYLKKVLLNSTITLWRYASNIKNLIELVLVVIYRNVDN